MKVKIIQGTFGYRPEGSLHPVPVSAGGIADVPKETAEWLVSIGVAAYESGEQPVVPHEAEKAIEPTDYKEIAEAEAHELKKPDYAAMSFSDLRSEAVRRGLDMKVLKSRAAITEALEADDNELPPVIGASEPL